jgi:hypothetical protein
MRLESPEGYLWIVWFIVRLLRNRRDDLNVMCGQLVWLILFIKFFLWVSPSTYWHYIWKKFFQLNTRQFKCLRTTAIINLIPCDISNGSTLYCGSSNTNLLRANNIFIYKVLFVSKLSVLSVLKLFVSSYNSFCAVVINSVRAYTRKY